ncbi:MAG TPA: dihydropteroate synthase [Casimicrobiaceae bacterium]|nr:dihydropteroate synthase [Casimicrobiaceae bacterium]
MNDAHTIATIRPAMLTCGRHALSLDRPLVMGVINLTPDSFFEGSRVLDRSAALDAAQRMIAEGADLIDVGAESTRPGAAPVSEDEELERLVPLVEKLAASDVPVSADTRKPAVMHAAIAAGAGMINDVSALRAPGALEVIASAAQPVAVCLMHMQGEPATMQQAPAYGDVVTEVKRFLGERARACAEAGIGHERIVLDPGFGFGKTVAHNLALLRALPEIGALGYPVLAGLSRKATIGAITGREVGDRLAGSLAAALAAVAHGAAIVRVHDVRETVDALKVWSALQNGKTLRH